MKLILGSGSPRRKEILSRLPYSYEVYTADVKESEDNSLGLEGLSLHNARLKSEAVYAALGSKENLVLGSDTVVWLDGVAYGKPRDKEQAYDFLSQLSGKTHRVGTGVALTSIEGTELFCEVAEVTFKPLTRSDIEHYVEDVPVLDKAGAYAIQEGGDRIIEKFTGEFETIMGLPLSSLQKALARYSIT